MDSVIQDCKSKNTGYCGRAISGFIQDKTQS